MRVFLSSTIYDLIDVRAEISELLRALGVEPVLSDDKHSDFHVLPDANSIRACLVNLETCDHVLVVLDKRYGPSLATAGFDDASATHLEYRHARTHQKPIHFFVRDRLQADFDIWKKNKRSDSIELSWIDTANRRLFEFLEEHSKLSGKKTGSNWCTPFRDSHDLKLFIKKALGPALIPQQLVEMINRNQFPIFSVVVETEPNFLSPNGLRCVAVKAIATNIGGAPAFDAQLAWGQSDARLQGVAQPKADYIPTVLAPGQSTIMSFIYAYAGQSDSVTSRLIIRYKSALGFAVDDQYDVGIRVVGLNSLSPIAWSGASHVHRKFSRAAPISLQVDGL